MSIDITSWELTKELQELSGWEPDASSKELQQVGFSLGYLLRKLPMRLPIGAALDDDVAYFFRLSEGMEDKWQIDYRDGFDGQYTAVVALIPEDAACKLAIELFKQEILTRD